MVSGSRLLNSGGRVCSVLRHSFQCISGIPSHELCNLVLWASGLISVFPGWLRLGTFVAPVFPTSSASVSATSAAHGSGRRVQRRGQNGRRGVCLISLFYFVGPALVLSGNYASSYRVLRFSIDMQALLLKGQECPNASSKKRADKACSTSSHGRKEKMCSNTANTLFLNFDACHCRHCTLADSGWNQFLSVPGSL